MRTSKFTSLILTLITLILCINSSYGHPMANKPNSCLKINGIILKAPHKAERGSYKVELLKDNVVIDSTKVPVNKEFIFTLSKNSWYTIRVTKPGHIPFLLSIDTKLDDNNALVYEFLFETELLDAKKMDASNEIMELPIGLVQFDKQNNRFYPVENYTADIKQKIFDPSKPKFFNANTNEGDKSMMANQDDDDMIVK